MCTNTIDVWNGGGGGGGGGCEAISSMMHGANKSNKK
jgi:hypothetical protein